MDKFLRIVHAKYPEEFERKVNELLTQGCWRVAETEMSVTDHHYWAMLIQSSHKEKKNCLVEDKDEISKN